MPCNKIYLCWTYNKTPMIAQASHPATHIVDVVVGTETSATREFTLFLLVSQHLKRNLLSQSMLHHLHERNEMDKWDNRKNHKWLLAIQVADNILVGDWSLSSRFVQEATMRLRYVEQHSRRRVESRRLFLSCLFWPSLCWLVGIRLEYLESDLQQRLLPRCWGMPDIAYSPLSPILWPIHNLSPRPRRSEAATRLEITPTFSPKRAMLPQDRWHEPCLLVALCLYELTWNYLQEAVIGEVSCVLLTF